MRPMSLIADAKAFIDTLLHPRNERVCPRCGLTGTKKNGAGGRNPRDLGGIRSVRIQRHWCYTCKLPYDEELPDIAPHDWYTRRVKRKFLDLYTTIGGSLRRCASWITAEITNRGPTYLWDPLARAGWWGCTPRPEKEIEVSHNAGRGRGQARV